MFYYNGYSDSLRVIFLNNGMLFCLVAILFYFVRPKKRICENLSNVFFIALVGFLLSYLIQMTAWRYHFYPAYSFACLLVIILVANIITNTKQKAINYAFMILLTIITLVIPIQYFNFGYHHGVLLTEGHKKLLHYLQSYANDKSVYFLTIDGEESYPVLSYAKVINPSRFQHLLWIPGATREMFLEGSLPPYKINGENYFINLLNEDLIHSKPDLIFVDAKDLHKFNWFVSFDYLAYLSKNPTFQKIWQNYRYLTTIEQHYPDLKIFPSGNYIYSLIILN
jgi:hypothetical protein